MRIQSPFHDYYDSALGHGADPELLYLRTPRQENPLPSTGSRRHFFYAGDVDEADGLPAGFCSPIVRHDYKKSRHLYIVPVYVALAGQWYTTWSCRIEKDVRPDPPQVLAHQVFHSTLEVKAWVEENLSLTAVDLKKSTWSKLFRALDRQERAAQSSAPAALEFNRSANSPVVVIGVTEDLRRLEALHDKKGRSYVMDALVAPSTESLRKWRPQELTTFANLPLRILDFARVIDPYQTFQRISECLGGVLNRPENAMVEISDKSLLAKHGFDPRYGFRHRPG